MKAIKILLIVVSMPICACILTRAGIWVNRRLSNERTLQITAAKLGVKPTWAHVRFHVYCRVVIIGRSKADIESELNKLGALNDDQATYGFYIFQQPDLNYEIEEIVVHYELTQKLEDRHIVGRVPWADSYDGAIKNIDCAELERLAQ